MRPRVVSLVPSSTETLLALGADVVACTRFCERPELEHVGGTKNPDISAIVELAPDVVVIDREENRIEDHDSLVAAGLRVVVSHVVDVASAVDVVAQLADAGGVAAPSDLRVPAARPPSGRRAFVPIWRRPWMTISPATYGASLLTHLGIELVAAGHGEAYPTVDLATVSRPDVVLVPSEPYDFQPAHFDELRDAFPDVEVMPVDGQDLFWWGVRTPAAITRLAEALSLPPTL